ncbi:MAG: aspartate-semialdehyde dehydrogenase [Planctomycetota bacterium]
MKLSEIMPGADRTRLTAALAAPVRKALANKTIAIIGATGAVGLEALALLVELGVTPHRIVPVGSVRSEGRAIQAAGQTFQIRSLEHACDADVAILATPADASRSLGPLFQEAGVLVSDNSSAFRHEAPLVIPEINPDAISKGARIVSTPNCTTTIALMGLAGVLRELTVDAIDIVSYQAVSGAGIRAMHALIDESREVVSDRHSEPRWLLHDVAFNVFPHESDLDPATGQCREERKFALETSRLLQYPPRCITATCLRVPVLRAHTVVAGVSLRDCPTTNEVAGMIGGVRGVRLADGTLNSSEATGSCEVHVDRIRVDPNPVHGGSVMRVIISGDQLLKGAAWNAIQNAAMLLEMSTQVQHAAQTHNC